ncbi:MAG: DNA cytosine methyltransferase [Syntrophorhabdus sp.]|nr:DNA cytosine methyltransferase [Syntrophorhabdus sp.]
MNYIDVFAGAGGLSEGFTRAGFKALAHIENDSAACFTLKTRLAYRFFVSRNDIEPYINYLKGKITRSKLYSLVPEKILQSVISLTIGDENNPRIFQAIDELRGDESVDILVGGPPCQAYSLVGRARDANGMEGDPRGYLYVQYGKFLARYRPKIFVFENVTGLLSAKSGWFFTNIRDHFGALGYELKLFIVNAKDFGVLQDRKRIILIGWHKEIKFQIDEICKSNFGEYQVSHAFMDLPKIKAGEGVDKFSRYINGESEYLKFAKIRNGIDVLTQHVARPQTEQDKEIYRIAVEKWRNNRARLNYNELPERLKTHKNIKSFSDRFKVVADVLPYSHTVVAHIAKDGHYYIHPDIEQNRSITVREAARLQSFPDDYYFEGTKEGQARTPAYRQIGNAVPPLLAEKIANNIAAWLK